MLRNIPIVRLRILAPLFLVWIFVGAQKIETVNAVRIIHNEKGGKWGANPEVKLELVRTIGGLDAEENLSFKELSDIVRDSVGNLYLPLNYGTDVIEKGFISHWGGGVGITYPRMNTVSRGIAADGKGRIWVITQRHQLAKEEESLRVLGGVSRKVTEPKVVEGDVYKLEIFSPDGIFLGEIPLTHNAHRIRIFGDILFIGEYYNTIFYQYKIVEK